MVFHQQILFLCSMQMGSEVKITSSLAKLGIILISQGGSLVVLYNVSLMKHLLILGLLVDQMQEDLINKDDRLYLLERLSELLLLQMQNFKGLLLKLSTLLILLLLLKMYQLFSHQVLKLTSQFILLLLRINLLNSVVLRQ